MIVALKRFTNSRLNAAAGEVRQVLRETTPVDTGRARDSWTVSPANVSRNKPASVGSNVDYMDKLNAGSSPQAPAGFVEAALDEGLRRYKAKK